METLWQQYKDSVFFIEQPLSEQLNFAIITAYNPEGQVCNLGANRLRDKALQHDINQLKIPYRRIWGCSPQLDYSEKSWVIATEKKQAIELAIKYQQNAIYWIEQGMLYLTPCLMHTEAEELLGRFNLRIKGEKLECCY